MAGGFRSPTVSRFLLCFWKPWGPCVAVSKASFPPDDGGTAWVECGSAQQGIKRASSQPRSCRSLDSPRPPAPPPALLSVRGRGCPCPGLCGRTGPQPGSQTPKGTALCGAYLCDCLWHLPGPAPSVWPSSLWPRVLPLWWLVSWGSCPVGMGPRTGLCPLFTREPGLDAGSALPSPCRGWCLFVHGCPWGPIPCLPSVWRVSLEGDRTPPLSLTSAARVTVRRPELGI